MHDTGDEGPRLVSNRTMDIAVALVLMAGAGIVIMDSLRVGMRWQEAEGPAAGYFPFYIGILLAAASLYNLVKAFGDRAAAQETFVTRPAMGKVLAVLVPLVVYVFVLGFTGIYVASAIYIALFMRYFGGYSLVRGLLLGAAIALALFMMFEVWFLVPLPKGPLEEWLGY
jgi:hypothetical protein